MAKVLSLQEVELHPHADEREFQHVVLHELAPFYRQMAWEVRLLKGNRGARNGQYLLIFEIPSVSERDRLVPQEGTLSEEGKEIFAASGPVWEKLNALATQLLEAIK